jgi:hypothetical protein
MCKQTGARYLHRRKTRKDKSFNGIVKLTNYIKSIRLSSGNLKRVKHV